MAQTVHLTLKVGEEVVEGESTIEDMDRDLTIECLSFNYALTTPRKASGHMTGKREHQPLTIVKHIDKSSPLLFKALCLTSDCEATFNFYRSAEGVEGDENFYRIVLKKARIIKVAQTSEDATMGGDKAPPALETVSFTFEDIVWTYIKTGAEHEDSWSKGSKK
jgi:type VI secretion system secreted protein Hcp